MAEGLITEATMAILTTVLSHAAEKIELAWNSKEKLKELEKKLSRVHMLLCGAAESDHTSYNPILDDWLLKVKTVAYDADDLLDGFAYEALKRRLLLVNQSPFKNKLRYFVSLGSNPVVFRFQMGHRVKHLMGLMADVFAEAQELGIKPVDLTAGPSIPIVNAQLQVQRELVAGRGLIGRDQDESNIVRMLCAPENVDRDLTVVAIVGMAGLGKTALSKRAFDRKEVNQHFEKKLWVCVSHDFEVKGILAEMVELVGGQTSTRSSHQATLQELQKHLRGIKYLLVLDDVWDTISSVWESLTSALLDIGGLKGTVVLATSRSSLVAATMEIHSEDQDLPTRNHPLLYKLRGLNYDDSWSLFMRRINHNIDVSRAKRMVAKCKGVPLAINTLAALLRYRNLEEWREIEENEIWKLEDNTGILPSLKLSFNYLPSAAVKNCFAYCAIFPEDAIIRREHLIQLWMAQGFLPPCDKMEQIGNDYFNILLNNSLFQDVVFDKHGKVASCRMHDVVHALAKAVARQECLILSKSVDLNNISSDVRHLSLLTNKPVSKEMKKKLRSLISESLRIKMPRDLLMHAKGLRVLSLVNSGITELPDSIGCFKHLRYLDISENEIMKLPPAVCKLYNLQTFRHLRSRLLYWFTTYPTLPEKLGELVNLRYICTNKFSCMDFSLSLLLESNTSTVRRLACDEEWGGRVSDISSLNNIRGSLAIWYLEHVSSGEDARKANLRRKANIHQLDLTWSYNAPCLTNCEEVLEELQPHESLKILSIWYYNGKELPTWLMETRTSKVSKLVNLVEMKMYYCRNLKQLPTSLVFPSLKVLVVWGCDNLTSFPDLDGMKSLETLHIGRCPMLEGVPNLEPLTNLCRLEIHNCARVTTLPLGLPGLGNLTELEIGPLCPELDFFPFPDISDSCPLTKSLQKLCLIGWPNVGNLPDQLEHFTLLWSLSISSFTCLRTLPNWLGNLTCLEIVDLQQMENLMYLPSRNSMLRATRFRGFRIRPFHCPKLSISMDSSICMDLWTNI